MGRVRALLALEVSLAVAPRPRRRVAAILAAEALEAGPGLEQRAVHREVLARQQPLHLRQCKQLRQEALRHLAGEQPVAVLAERARVPNRVVHPEPDEPAEQEVELQPLHQLALRAHRVEALHQQRPQQPLGRDARPAQARVERFEVRRHRRQHGVHDITDRAQRMVRWYPRLQINIGEQRARPPILAPHRHRPRCFDPILTESSPRPRRKVGFLQQPARGRSLPTTSHQGTPGAISLPSQCDAALGGVVIELEDAVGELGVHPFHPRLGVDRGGKRRHCGDAGSCWASQASRSSRTGAAWAGRSAARSGGSRALPSRHDGAGAMRRMASPAIGRPAIDARRRTSAEHATCSRSLSSRNWSPSASSKEA